MNHEHYIEVAKTVQELANQHGESFYSLLENHLRRGEDFSTAVFSTRKHLVEFENRKRGKNG